MAERKHATPHTSCLRSRWEKSVWSRQVGLGGGVSHEAWSVWKVSKGYLCNAHKVLHQKQRIFMLNESVWLTTLHSLTFSISQCRMRKFLLHLWNRLFIACSGVTYWLWMILLLFYSLEFVQGPICCSSLVQSNNLERLISYATNVQLFALCPWD